MSNEEALVASIAGRVEVRRYQMVRYFTDRPLQGGAYDPLDIGEKVKKMPHDIDRAIEARPLPITGMFEFFTQTFAVVVTGDGEEIVLDGSNVGPVTLTCYVDPTVYTIAEARKRVFNSDFEVYARGAARQYKDPRAFLGSQKELTPSALRWHDANDKTVVVRHTV